MADLNKIFLRTKVGSQWKSVSLQELHDTGRGGDVYEWGLKKLIELEEVIITPGNLSAFVDVIKSFGVTVFELKDETI